MFQLLELLGVQVCQVQLQLLPISCPLPPKQTHQLTHPLLTQILNLGQKTLPLPEGESEHGSTMFSIFLTLSLQGFLFFLFCYFFFLFGTLFLHLILLIIFVPFPVFLKGG